MPGLDGTGPRGARLIARRGAGYCTRDFSTWGNHPVHQFRNAYGIGYRGRGRGWRYRVCTTDAPGPTSPTTQQDIADLTALADQLKIQLDAIHKRLSELNS
jgi:hypothetical protein